MATIQQRADKRREARIRGPDVAEVYEAACIRLARQIASKISGHVSGSGPTFRDGNESSWALCGLCGDA